MIIRGRTEFYDKLILFLRRNYEKVTFVAWFDHRRCIDDDAKTVIVRRGDLKLAAITFVRSRGHKIGATASHDLPETILANQGAPADHSKISARRTDWIQSVGLNSVGATDPPVFSQQGGISDFKLSWAKTSPFLCFLHFVDFVTI